MKFKITRTRDWNRNKPCKKAIKVEDVQTHTIKDVTSPYDLMMGIEKWYADGVNHRVGDNCLQRDFISHHWEIEINTIEELLDLIKEEGEIVMGDDSIEIYDNYRE
jgi:hypothetical protein